MVVRSGDDGHLLLPVPLRPAEGDLGARDAAFAWARERLRVLSAATPRDAVAEYESAGDDGSDARRYGHALALMRDGKGAAALARFDALLARHPDHLWVRLGAAEAAHEAGRRDDATRRYESLLADYRDHRAVSLSYAEALNERGTAEAGRRAQAVLRPLLVTRPDDLLLQQRFARASELAGDANRAAEAHAEAAFLAGRAEDALRQLDALKQRDDVDYVQRARVEARMAEWMPVVLEMRRMGLRPQDQGRPRQDGSRSAS